VRHITVTVPDEVYRSARIRAAEQGRSVSALVTDFLRSIVAGDAEFRRLEQQQHQVQTEILQFRAGERLSRDEVHDRAIR